MTDLSPFVWAVLAAICWGLAPITEKLGLRGATDPVVGVFVRSVGVFLGTLVLAAFTPQVLMRAQALSLRTWGYLISGGILASILGQVCFYRALKLGEVSRVVPIGAAYPVLAFLLGVLFFNESITAIKILGIVLVMAGVYLLR